MTDVATPDPTDRSGWLTTFLFGTTRTPSVLLDGPMLLARLYAGVTIAGAGLDKLPRPDWMVDQVTQMGFPAPAFSATAACVTEFVAGALLALGLLTRPAAISLAIVMGTASFGFHRVPPITGMHIAQGFTWLFVVFAVVGAGRLSLDQVVRCARSRFGATGPAVGFALAAAILAIGVGIEVLGERPAPAGEASAVAIESVSVAGTFNDWDLEATPMVLLESGVWSAEIPIASPGVLELKFAANGGWDTNIGDDDQAERQLPVKATGASGGGNIVLTVPRPGTLVLSVDPESLEYSATLSVESE